MDGLRVIELAPPGPLRGRVRQMAGFTERGAPLRRHEVPIAGLVVVLSLGPEGIAPLYRLVYDALFGMAAIRATPRFSVLALCGIAVLAAIAIRSLEERWPRLRVLAGVTIALTALEYSNGAIALPEAPALTTDVGRWIRTQPGTGAVICLPIGVFSGNTPCMLESLEHRRSIVNGYSGVMPPFYEALVDTMSRLPSPESLLASFYPEAPADRVVPVVAALAGYFTRVALLPAPDGLPTLRAHQAACGRASREWLARLLR